MLTAPHPALPIIEFVRDESVGMLTLSRADKLNAMNPAMLAELRELGVQLLNDERGQRGRSCLSLGAEGTAFSADSIWSRARGASVPAAMEACEPIGRQRNPDGRAAEVTAL